VVASTVTRKPKIAGISMTAMLYIPLKLAGYQFQASALAPAFPLGPGGALHNMKVFCLGGAGMICREAALDLFEHGDFDLITIGDVNPEAAREVAISMNSPKVDAIQIDVSRVDEAIEILRPYDIVVDGTTISLNRIATECIARAGCHGINLNGFGEEYQYDAVFRQNGKTFVPGFGMTPGTTNMMAVKACEVLDEVKIIRVSHGAFRPIAFSKSITETTTYEYDPDLPGRVVYQKGEYIKVKPFARPRTIALPPPYPALEQYIIPHSEQVTLSKWLKNQGKDADLIEVRGSWPKQNMALVRSLYDYGILRNEKIAIGGIDVGILDCVAEYLLRSTEGRTTELYGYALHVQVEGYRNSEKIRLTLTHTHPASDGTVKGWEKLRAYTRCVAIPMAIGAQLIAKGQIKDGAVGVRIPEDVFHPDAIFSDLEKRGIFIHLTEEPIEEFDYPEEMAVTQ
jgi:saccharopine dehydrogenase-like NADP-dependent oxidoreductase